MFTRPPIKDWAPAILVVGIVATIIIAAVVLKPVYLGGTDIIEQDTLKANIPCFETPRPGEPFCSQLCGTGYPTNRGPSASKADPGKFVCCRINWESQISKENGKDICVYVGK